MTNRNWKPFIRTRQNYSPDELRLSLRPDGRIAISRAAFHAMRSPAAVAMFYDAAAGLIGMTPVEPTSPNALPVRKNSQGQQRHVTVEHFCTTFGLAIPKRSTAFPNPTFDPDGTLVLNYRAAVEATGAQASPLATREPA